MHLTVFACRSNELQPSLHHSDGMRSCGLARAKSATAQKRSVLVPTISGVVTNISADRISDQRTGQAYFTVELTVDRTPRKDYPDAHIIPGMPVEVAIDTGTRTALDYFVEPISDVFRRGMREN